ncbi:Hypothetical predicted protein, partial [Paramuricea clavata]
MFHGTRHISGQIVETCVITKKFPVLAKQCINEESSLAVYQLFQKLRGVMSFDNDVSLSEGVGGVGKEGTTQHTESQVLAVQYLIKVEVNKRCGLMYSRFVAEKKNREITFEHD